MFKWINVSASGEGIFYIQIITAPMLGFGACNEHTWVKTSTGVNTQGQCLVLKSTPAASLQMSLDLQGQRAFFSNPLRGFPPPRPQ